MMTTPVFHIDKALQAVLYIANRLDRKDFHKIFKILYFADRAHLATWGRTISGDTYIAMDAGPVPTRIYDMFKIVRGDSLFSSDNRLFDFYSRYFTVAGNHILVPRKDADLDYLSATDIQFLDKSIAENKNLSFQQIKDKSHDFAWSNTPKDSAIDYADILREEGANEDFIAFVNEGMRVERHFADRRENVCQ